MYYSAAETLAHLLFIPNTWDTVEVQCLLNWIALKFFWNKETESKWSVLFSEEWTKGPQTFDPNMKEIEKSKILNKYLLVLHWKTQ